MICEKCKKEFNEDWRKDKQTIKKEPVPRFCSRSCANSRVQTEEMNEAPKKRVEILYGVWKRSKYRRYC
jgi:hypothetical protein